MKLPVLDTYAFPVTLPSTGKSINMRPYLVREEKLLLMAQESENYDDQVEAIAQIIVNCTNGAVDPRVVPYFDIEYLLLQLRSRSVGEITTPVYICHNKPNGTVECGHKSPVKINLNEITVSNHNQSSDKFHLKLSDRYTLHLRYPTIYTIHKLVISAIDHGQIKSESFMEALCDIFSVLEDHIHQQTYNFLDYTTQEKMEFLETLSTRNFEELIEFLEDLPTVEKSISFTCGSCQFNHAVTLSGLVDFLD